MFRFEPVRVDTSSGDENGRLIFDRDFLIAVAVQLDDPSHGAECSRWHLEVLFDGMALPPRTFATLPDLEGWLRQNRTNRRRHDA